LPTWAAATRLAEAWRPHRTWVVLLLRVLLEETTGEVRGTRG
jgi:3-methyladenine DNA glycosylase/8-oxoguanine DNA glycosylase